ncbi:MAG: undecaprenyl-diphosphate phosphatase [Erysipelothrix sp.]|nr:undecaprenyl-diphosphate phosphatase [Erysipelothrix sp.]
MIEIIKALILGIVQGITEWLPISSTAHLILLNDLIKLDVTPAFWDLFEVVIQLGSIMAVLILYFSQLNPFAKDKDEKEKMSTYRLWFMIVVASLPLIVVALFDDFIPDNPAIIAFTLILYGILFIVVERYNKTRDPKIKSMRSLDIKTALLIGCFQALAVIPGTSRSGATIIGASILGLSRTVAAEFSFFLAIPAMLGASGLKLLKYILKVGLSFTLSEVILLLVATIVSYVVSMFVIKNLLKYIRKHDFTGFGYYRIVLGIIIIITIIAKSLLA